MIFDPCLYEIRKIFACGAEKGKFFFIGLTKLET